MYPLQNLARKAVFTKIIGHVGHFRWLGLNVWWEIWQILIEYVKPIGQMSDDGWKFFGYTGKELTIHSDFIFCCHYLKYIWNFIEWEVKACMGYPVIQPRVN